MERRSTSGGGRPRVRARTSARAAAVLAAAALILPAALVESATGRTGPADSPAAQTDSAAVIRVIDRFHAALAAGDTAAVDALLHPDATILEAGGVETRAEYLRDHLPGDIAFARAVPRERGPIHVQVRGGTAWAHSTSTTTGRFRDRDIDSQSAELIVLVRDDGDWRIAAIHWSTRARRR